MSFGFIEISVNNIEVPNNAEKEEKTIRFYPTL